MIKSFGSTLTPTFQGPMADSLPNRDSILMLIREISGELVDTIGLSIETLYPLIDPALRTIISADGGTTMRDDADIVAAALASPLLNSSSMVGSLEGGVAFYAYMVTPFSTLSKAARVLKGTWVAPTGPTAFTFTDSTGAELSTLTESAAITVAGLDVAVWFAVTGGEAEVNDSGVWATSGVVINTDTVKVRRTSSADFETAVNVVLDINGVTDTWSLTTKSAVNPAFQLLIKTDNAGISNSTSIALGLVGSFDIDWGDPNDPDIETITNAVVATPTTHDYGTAGQYVVKIAGNLTRFTGYNIDQLKLLELQNWGTGFISTTCNGMFRGCSNLAVTASDALNLSLGPDLSYMFLGSRLDTRGNLGSWDTSTVLLGALFNSVTYFNQDISSWVIRANTTTLYRFVRLTAMSKENYSKLLISWANQVSTNSGPYSVDSSGQDGRTYDNTTYAGIQGGSPFTDAVSARAFLVLATGSGGAGWTITGDAAV